MGYRLSNLVMSLQDAEAYRDITCTVAGSCENVVTMIFPVDHETVCIHRNMPQPYRSYMSLHFFFNVFSSLVMVRGIFMLRRWMVLNTSLLDLLATRN